MVVFKACLFIYDMCMFFLEYLNSYLDVIKDMRINF